MSAFTADRLIDPQDGSAIHPSIDRRIDVVDPTVGSVRIDDDFDALFVQHYDRLVRTLTAIAGGHEAAADAVQDAFVRAHLRWRKVRQLDDPAGWVRRVAINRLHDHHRRSARGRRLFGVLTARHQSTTPEPTIDEFDRLLAELPRQQRAVTALFYVDAMTIAEIAAALEIAEGSVKSHLHDARSRIRRVLTADAGATPQSARQSASPTTPPAQSPPAQSPPADPSPWSRS